MCDSEIATLNQLEKADERLEKLILVEDFDMEKILMEKFFIIQQKILKIEPQMDKFLSQNL